jgi:hypothetical protein
MQGVAHMGNPRCAPRATAAWTRVREVLLSYIEIEQRGPVAVRARARGMQECRARGRRRNAIDRALRSRAETPRAGSRALATRRLSPAQYACPDAWPDVHQRKAASLLAASAAPLLILQCDAVDAVPEARLGACTCGERCGEERRCRSLLAAWARYLVGRGHDRPSHGGRCAISSRTTVALAAEDVPQVAAALGTGHLRACHAVRAVHVLLHRVLQGCEKGARWQDCNWAR